MTPTKQIEEARRFGAIVGDAYDALASGAITQRVFDQIKERAGSVVCGIHNLRTAVVDAEGQAVCLRCLEERA